MQWPTVEQTRAYFQMLIGAAIVIVLVYSVVGQNADWDAVIRVLMALLGTQSLVNGFALSKTSGNGSGDKH